MGFLSNLFGKKSSKLTQEQLDEIDEKVEETQIKHTKDREIFSNLRKPTKIVNPVKKKAIKPIKDTVKKSGAKKVRKPSRKKAKKGSKKKGRK